MRTHKNTITTFVAAWLFAVPAFAENEVLQVFQNKSYKPVPWEKIDKITFSNTSGTMNIIEGDGTSTIVNLDEGLNIPSAKAIPALYITTDEPLYEIPDKINYKTGQINLLGFDTYDDVTADVNIRGRGNSSWQNPKKPYRLKFNKKISLCGLPSAKNYVLLANSTDPTLMNFAVATKLGEWLDLPFTNKVVPVDVFLNRRYLGSYMLTNKPGINAGSVDIDEENSVMWELDKYFDEDMKFRSPLLDLPVMLSDPDMDEATFEKWKADFIAAEEAVVNGNASEYFDLDEFARYLLVYDIMANNDSGHPKSVKLYKTEGGKYTFGPMWDFDISAGYYWFTSVIFTFDYVGDLMWRNQLFLQLERDPAAQEAREKYWQQIKPRFGELMEFIDIYAETIRQSAYRNQTINNVDKDFDAAVDRVKQWYKLRFEKFETLE